MGVGVGVGGWWWWYSQRLLSLNPTTVMVVLLLGLWLLLGCDKNQGVYNKKSLNSEVQLLFYLTEKITVFMILKTALLDTK